MMTVRLSRSISRKRSYCQEQRSDSDFSLRFHCLFQYSYIFQYIFPLHKEFSEQIHKLIVEQVIDLNTRIELLTKKNIRDKLLAYFNLISSKDLRKSFTIPFSYTDLADYLSIDRSAMMRELSHLIEEGFIKKKGKRITLLYE